MRTVLCICVLCLAVSACGSFSMPGLENPVEQPTNESPPTAVPTKKPVQPTNTPAPSAIPTSEPLILTDDVFEADIKDTCETDVPILDYGDGVFSVGGGSISFIDGELAIWCYGARHQWIGTIEYEGYIFASDENDPLQFMIVKDAGYKFVGGVGTLTYPDGTQASLYRPTKAQLTPSAPESQVSSLFRDDFTVHLQEGWEWQNEDPSRWEISPAGWLKITGEDNSLLSNGAQSNLLCRAVSAGDIQVTVHMSADPRADFQQATLYLYQDGENFAAINRGYCGPCETGGSGIFMEYKLAAGWQAYNVKTQEKNVYLRLTSQGNIITGYYALEPEAWQSVGTVTSGLDISKICLGVTNADSAGINADLTGEFDYLEVSQP